MQKMNVKEEITILSRAKNPLIFVESHEESRIDKMLDEIAEEQEKEVYIWTVTQGMRNRLEKPVGASEGNPLGVLSDILKIPEDIGVFCVLKDYHKFIEDPVITRKLRDLHSILKGSNKTVIITTPKVIVPLELQQEVTILDLPLPTASELESVLIASVERVRKRKNKYEEEIQEAKEDGDTELVKKLKDDMKLTMQIADKLQAQLDANKDKLVQAGLGMTEEGFENVIARCLVQNDLNIQTINNEKKQVIRKGGLLEYFESEESLSTMGGLGNLKNEILLIQKCFTKEAEEFGLDRPKGILLIGPPGTGKSLGAKVIANVLQLPGLRLDMSDLVSKYYGQTANNVKAGLKLADTVAPVVFFWDEVEKMFSVGATGEGNEETMRVIGALLTHIEESTAPVLRVATCNNPKNLKPEFMQRFSHIIFVDLPKYNERKEIFAIHLKKIRRDPKKYNLNLLASSSEGYVGREIRNIVQKALATAFSEGKELTNEHLLEQIKKTAPMSVQKKEEIDEIRDWAEKAHALKASEEESAVTPGSKGREVDLI